MLLAQFVDQATCCMTRGSVFGSRGRLGLFLYRVQSLSGFCMGIKLPGREADHSRPSSDEVKNAWNYIPPCVNLASYLITRMDTFIFVTAMCL